MIEIFLLYDFTVTLQLLTQLHPFLILLIQFSIGYFYLNLRLELCASIAAIFFAAMLRKVSKHTSRNLLYLWTLPIYFITSIYVHFIAAAIVLLFLDYAAFPQSVYQQKTYNRLLLYTLIGLWNGPLDQSIALCLALGVAHGLFIELRK